MWLQFSWHVVGDRRRSSCSICAPVGEQSRVQHLQFIVQRSQNGHRRRIAGDAVRLCHYDGSFK
eukprot:XP_001709406.1 Hypothetical protein GL50803_1636 [Giardia lamblia ATCC 50803]